MKAPRNALLARNLDALGYYDIMGDDGERQQMIVVDGRVSRELIRVIALGALRSGVAFLRGQRDTAGELPPLAPPLLAPPPPEASARDVMTADEVAAFLGVDRNTVYDYAGRGVIPHQRLGKRMLFRRGALTAWLDTSCKAAATRIR